MRKVGFMLVTVVAALAVGATIASAEGGGNRVVASANGASFLTLENQFGIGVIDVGPFTFEAMVHADGSVDGRYDYRSLEDGVPFDLRGPLTCVVIRGNRAWLGGIVEKADPESIEGQEMWFQVADHGEPGKNADVTTLVGVSEVPGSAQDYCDRAPEPRFPFVIDRGNIQVRS